jgi:catechol 2,3-dioxygenase-like lactoylglutathione lyase family enzyme
VRVAVERLTHLGICVSNLERALVFYRDGLGFRELGNLDVEGSEAATLLELPGVELRAVYLERDGVRIELLHYPAPGHVGGSEPRAMNALGLTHLSFRVQDLDATLATLERTGGRVLEHTRTDNPRFSAAAVFVSDPDGTRIELVQAPGDPAALPGSGS